jgi:DNA-directed RNA polymerase subunit beta'
VEVVAKGRRKQCIVVKNATTRIREKHNVPAGMAILVNEGDHVMKGQPLAKGLVAPNECLHIRGLQEFQEDFVKAVQEVYRAQGVTIADKHIEIILRQMMRGKRSQVDPILLGITKASLQSRSFLSAASFQKTTQVLTEAAIMSKRDELLSLNGHVITGRLIPAGTGFDFYHQTRPARRKPTARTENQTTPVEPAGPKL